MQSLVTQLTEHPFFSGIAAEQVATISQCAAPVRIPARMFVFREGGEADKFYLIEKGKVALKVFAPERGAITIQTIGAGDVLGWSWLFPPYRWHFDARALEDTSLIAFDGACLRARMDEDHDLGYELMRRFAQIIVQRLQATRLQLLDLYGVHT